MFSRRRVLLPMVCLLGVAGLHATALAANDPLQTAKAQRTQEHAKAKTDLVQAMDKQIKDAGSAGNLDLLKTLTSQKDAFETTGILPDAAPLKDAVAAYTQAMHKADGELVAAYETAINSATPDQAMVLRKERRELLEGASDKPAADSPEAVGVLLDRARTQYTQEVTDAKKVYLHAFDVRIDTVSSSGDLNAVEKLQAARTAADSDSELPEGFTDSAINSARATYQRTVQTCNQKLAQSYREAVRNFTRLKAIDKAQAAQAEFEATGLSNMQTGAVPSAGNSGGGMSRLPHALPSYLTASGGYAAEKEGIRPAQKCVISTKATDLLTKDFLFDLSVHVPKENEEIIAGLGDGTDRGSIRIRIREDGGWGRRASLCHGDEWGETIGDIHKDEIYVIRFERHGGPITVSVGSIANGKFTADMTQTLSDPKELVPGLSEKRSAIFFEGDAVFCSSRLLIGANAAVSDAAGGGGHVASAFEPVQFSTAGAAPAATAAPAAEAGVYKLASDKLPEGFVATGTYGVRGGGLVPFNDKTFIQTKEGGFLSKDFVFETSVNIPVKPHAVEVGIGDGTVKGSLRLVVRTDGNWGLRAFLCQPGDEWGKKIADLHGDGPRILRLEKHGEVITATVGNESNGKFTEEATQTLTDLKSTAKEVTDRHAHLFFTGEEVWSQLKLHTGPAAAGEAP